MRKLFTTVAVGVLTLVGASMVYGQTYYRAWEITGLGGMRVYDDDVVFMDPGFVFGGKLAWFPHPNIGVEGTMSFSSADLVSEQDLEDLTGEEVDFEAIDVFEVRLDAVYQFLYNFDQRVVPYVSAGVGQFVFDTDGAEFNEPNTTFNWGGGLKIFFTPQFGIRLDARDNVAIVERDFRETGGALPGRDTKTFQANNPEFQGGIVISFGGSDEDFGIRDTDMDGVRDADDLCPNTPRGVIVDQTGCPVDSDGDGVPDGLDACPSTPAGAQVDERGCPLDSDNDGVYDGLDQCPNTPAGVQVDENGCPMEVEEEAKACLDDQSWYTGDATISFDGRSWVKFGATQTASMDILTQVGEYEGVPIYVGQRARQPYREVWLPLCAPADTYQPYRRVSEVRGTTGFIRDAN